jgi:DNA-binding GntR family transcriptional regulator
VTDSYFDPVYSKVQRLLRHQPSRLISELIEENYGRSSAEVHQTITAIAISPREATILNVEPGSPALRIVRRYVDKMGQTFETTISIHPAGRYTCSIVLKRINSAKPDTKYEESVD